MRFRIAALVIVLPAAAAATPHALPFSYPYATLGAGALEVEEYVDLTPAPILNVLGTGSSPTLPALRMILTTEIEYGITDRLEAGFYVEGSNDLATSDGSVPGQIDGIKQRLRYRLAEPGQWPVDLSLYGEVAELVNEVELEAKVNLEKRIGWLQILVNLWAESELYYSGQQEWVMNPSAGASFQVLPALHIGIEYWARGEYGVAGAGSAFNPQLHHYLGPALLLQTGRIWLAAAPYVRLDHLGRSPELGDDYGPVWVRTILGLEF